jgi:hypothetical protein
MVRYSNQDYEKLDRTAIELRKDYNFLDYELDVFKLAEYLGITLIKYSQMSSDILQSLNENYEVKDGFTVIRICGGECGFTTYYNDLLSLRRQRFTIAHEIKHVIFCETNPTEKDEELANHFARVLLAPSCLALFLMEKGEIDFCRIFNISSEAAENTLFATSRRKKSKGLELNDYEIEFINLIK